MVHKGNGRNEVFNGGIRLVSGGKVLVGERVSLLVERGSEEKKEGGGDNWRKE